MALSQGQAWVLSVRAIRPACKSGTSAVLEGQAALQERVRLCAFLFRVWGWGRCLGRARAQRPLEPWQRPGLWCGEVS